MEGLTSDERKALIRSVGTHRGERSLSPVEVALLLERSLQAGVTRDALADQLGIGSSQIASFLRLLSLDPEVRHLATWGRSDQGGVAFSSMSEVARLPSGLHEVATQAALENNLTWKEVVQLVQVVERGSEPFESSLEKILGLRPTIDRRYVVIGEVPHPLRAPLGALTQKQRDSILEAGVMALLDTEEPNVSPRLGVSHFHLSSDFNLLAVLNLTADELQQELMSLLERRLPQQ